MLVQGRKLNIICILVRPWFGFELFFVRVINCLWKVKVKRRLWRKITNAYWLNKCYIIWNCAERNTSKENIVVLYKKSLESESQSVSHVLHINVSSVCFVTSSQICTKPVCSITRDPLICVYVNLSVYMVWYTGGWI